MKKIEEVNTPSATPIVSAEDESLQQKLEVLKFWIFKRVRERLDAYWNGRNREYFSIYKSKYRKLQLKYGVPDLIAFINKLDVVFGEDNYDISEEHCVVIKMEDFTITNTLGQTHDVYGYYMQLTYQADNWQFKGTKTHWDEYELINGNPHPHTSSENYHDFNNICMGNGQLGMLLGQFNSMDNFDQNIFEFLLVSILPYLKWESIEGIPYLRLDDIYFHTVQNEFIYKGRIKKALKEFVKTYTPEIHLIPLSKYEAKRVKIKLYDECGRTEGNELFVFKNEMKYLEIIPIDKKLYEDSSKPKQTIINQTEDYSINIGCSIKQKFHIEASKE